MAIELVGEAKFCVRCRHFVVGLKGEKSRCLMPNFSALDLVTGTRVGCDPYAERVPNGRCGEEGVGFSPKAEWAPVKPRHPNSFYDGHEDSI